MKKQKIFILIISLFFTSLLPGETIIKGIHLSRVFLIDALGDIFVDNDINSIACYSPDGKSKFKFGQAGEGPGDIKRMGWFAINPIDNYIYVTEFFEGNKWISIFSRDGKIVSTRKVNIDLRESQGLSFIQFDSRGNMFIQSHKEHYRPYKDFMISKDVYRLLKFSPGGESFKEIYMMEQDFSADKGGKGNITIPFFNYLVWTIYEDKIIIRENINDFFSLYDADGKLVKKYPIPFKREKVTEKDIDEWEARIKTTTFYKEGISQGWLDFKYWRKRLPFPRYKPICGAHIYVDSQGNVYNMSLNSKDNYNWARINLKTGQTSIINFKKDYSPIINWKGYFYFKRSISDEDYEIVKMSEKEANEKIVKLIKVIR